MQYEYQVGGSLRVDAPSYVKRQADQDLYEALQSRQFCYVFNSRQMGKSSLRVRVMHRLRREGYCCVALDMTRIGSEYLTPHQWYERVVFELWRGTNLTEAVNLQAWLDQHPEYSLAQLLDRFIAEVLLVQIAAPIVIFVDEIDSLLSLDFSVNDFFALIRACYNHRVDQAEYERLTFCLLGVTTPSDLIQDKTRTPFNVGRAIALHGFQVKEAQPLATGLVGKADDPQVALQQILEWTGGQPFLTQKVCQLVVQAANADQKPLDIAAIDALVETHLIHHWESQDEPEHLRTIRDRLLRNEIFAGRLLGLYQQILQQGQISADDSEGQMELRLSGLVVKQAAVLTVYNPIYAAVFNLTWVQKTLDRLRPYAEALNAWVSAKQRDESRLLRGQALEEALQWSAGKSLSIQDVEFLRSSQALENRKTKQDVEILAEANQTLADANQTAKRRIRIGAGVLGMAILLAGAVGLWASQAIEKASHAIHEADTAKHEASTAKQDVADTQTVVRLEQASADALKQFQSHQTEALLSAMRTAYELKQLTQQRKQTTYLTTTPIVTLQSILDRIRERGVYLYSSRWVFAPKEAGGFIVFLHSSVPGVFPWDIQDKLPDALRTNLEVTSALLSPNGQYIAAILKGRVTLVDLQGKPLAVLSGVKIDDILRFSPNGQFIVAGNKLWNLQGQPLATLGDDSKSIQNVEFSSNSQLILITRGYAVGSTWRGTVELWNLQGKRLATLDGHQSRITTAAHFSPNGQYVVTGGGDGNAIVWNLQGRRLTTLTGHRHDVSAVRFSPDGRYILTGDSRAVRLWNLQGQQLALFNATEEGRITDVQFSPDGQSLAAGVMDYANGGNKLLVWNLQGKLLASFTPSHSMTAIQFNADGTYIAAFDEVSPYNSLWKVQGNQLATLPDQAALGALKFSPRGDRIATLEGSHGTVRVWDLQGHLLATLRGHRGHITRVEFSPKGDRILTSSDYDNTVRVWDLDGHQKAILQGHWKDDWKDNWDSVISPDGKYTLTRDKFTVRLWDLEGKPLATLNGFGRPPAAVQFNPKRHQLLTTCGDFNSSICLWNFEGQQLAKFEYALGSIQNLHFNSDGKHIISTSANGRYQVWNLQGNQVTLSDNDPKTNQALALITESDRLISPSNDTAMVLMRGRLVTLQGREGWFPQYYSQYSSPTSAQFSANGDRVAITGAGCKVRVWDANGNQLADYDGGCPMALNPDGTQIMLVSGDNIPTLWQVDDLDGLLLRGCDWLKTYLMVGEATDSDRQMCAALRS